MVEQHKHRRIERAVELDLRLANAWISTLLQEKGADIFRMKGVLAMAGDGRKYVYQGVHSTPRAAAASALCVPRRPARPVPKLTSLASGRGRCAQTCPSGRRSPGAASLRFLDRCR